MTRKISGRKWHVKPRIFVMLLLLMLVVFSSVFVAFNLFIRNYIRTNVRTQLDQLVKSAGPHDDWTRGLPPNDFYLPDLSGQPINKIGSRGEVIMLDSDYNVKGYDEFRSDEDADELAQIASYLKNKNISLSNAQYVFVRTDQGEYYISSIQDNRLPGNYFVFFVSVTGINHLVKTVNIAMAIIVAGAMLICFLIANVIAGSITKPVTKLSAFAVEVGRGNFARKEFAFQDIEFDDLGEAMNRSAEQLDKYDRDQRAFFQNVSHELRTPLMSIRCFAEGVECGLMEAKKSGATIVAETDRLSDLVEDLLYISRVDTITGSSHVEMREGDLRDTLSVCAAGLRSVAVKNGIDIDYQFDEEPVLFVYNEKHMHRAFSNLITNALRYAKNTITLRCRTADSGVEVSIADDGAGISQEDLPHIFERFYKGAGGKHGIGLSIVKAVVDLHQGEISVECDKNTQFTMLFRL